MKLQIILPTFNASKFFPEALSSVAGFPDSEILVIDDGSSIKERDAVAKACKEFDNVQFFAEPHRGLVGALQFGISITTAPYIARMDADDISLKGRFAAQLSFLKENPEVGLVGGQVEYIDEFGIFHGERSRFPQKPREIARKLVTKGCVIMHPTVMARSEIFSIATYRVVAAPAEDYDLWLRLSEHVDLANLPHPVLRYRRHSSQISYSKNWQQRFSRDLVRKSAISRQKSLLDPLVSLTEPIDWNVDIAASPPQFRQFILAYQALGNLLLFKSLITPANQDLILNTASLGFFGDGRNIRAKIVCLVGIYAWERRQWSRYIVVLALLIRLRPSFFLKFIFRGRSIIKSFDLTLPSKNISQG